MLSAPRRQSYRNQAEGNAPHDPEGLMLPIKRPT
jgi:hypothetical protein